MCELDDSVTSANTWASKDEIQSSKQANLISSDYKQEVNTVVISLQYTRDFKKKQGVVLHDRV